MKKSMTFGLNRILAPNASLEEFFSMAQQLGIAYVELRNDLGNGEIFDGLASEQVASLAEYYGVTIHTINALQRFNTGGDLTEKVEELKPLLAQAVTYGCSALVMCPVNDPDDQRDEEESLSDTVTALKTYAPYFKEAGVLGLIEPLGFTICSLRTKSKAVKAMQLAGEDETYRLVHDTFHHYLAGEDRMFPSQTGLVHISGVEAKLPLEEIFDEHRILVGTNDIMSNLVQIQTLREQGYEGVISFEPFGAAVQELPQEDLLNELRKSIALIQGDYVFFIQ